MSLRNNSGLGGDPGRNFSHFSADSSRKPLLSLGGGKMQSSRLGRQRMHSNAGKGPAKDASGTAHGGRVPPFSQLANVRLSLRGE